MPISDYANAFFFVRRSRVTPGCPPLPRCCDCDFDGKVWQLSPAFARSVPSSARVMCGQDTARENSRVKKFRDKDKSPTRPGSHGPPLVDRLFRELRDLMR